MLGEVLADEHVEKLGVAAKVGLCEYHELPLAGADSDSGRTVEVLGIASEHRRSDEDGSRARVLSLREHLSGGIGVATNETVEEWGLVNWHETTVVPVADDVLTPG